MCVFLILIRYTWTRRENRRERFESREIRAVLGSFETFKRFRDSLEVFHVENEFFSVRSPRRKPRERRATKKKKKKQNSTAITVRRGFDTDAGRSGGRIFSTRAADKQLQGTPRGCWLPDVPGHDANAGRRAVNFTRVRPRSASAVPAQRSRSTRVQGALRAST